MTITPVDPHPTDESPDTSGIDLAALRWDDITMWEHLDGEAVFARMRAERPVLWCDEPEIPGFGKGPGYWSLTRYADVMEVSRNPQRFVSGQGTNIPDMPVEIAEFFGSMINMDAPRHTRLRLIVNRAFTPRQVARIEGHVQEKAEGIVAAVAERGECDFVTDIAARLPLEVICEMVGIPSSDYQRVFELTNTILGAGDAEYTPDFLALMNAAVELSQMAQEISRARLVNPTDDLITALMTAEVPDEDGNVQRLTAEELGSFFILLVAAGNETTRNAISHGLNAFLEHPEQWDDLVGDVDGAIGTATEEILRWASPVMYFRRNVLQDTALSGVEFKAGEKVSIWYCSANRDEDVFADPFAFDIRRQPNDHLAFGGGGPHFCLGSSLARMEIRVLFEELAQRAPRLSRRGPTAPLRSNFIGGIKHLPMAFGA